MRWGSKGGRQGSRAAIEDRKGIRRKWRSGEGGGEDEEWETRGLKTGKGGDGSEVQKPTVMVPVQREGGRDEGKEREEGKGRRDRRGVGTQNWPLMESKHYSLLTQN